MKQTTHKVSCQSLLNHGNFSAGLYIKQGSSRGSLQRFSSSSLLLNRSIRLLFSAELMEKEPRHHLVQNCLHSTFAVEQLPIHFKQGSSRGSPQRFSSSSLLLNRSISLLFSAELMEKEPRHHLAQNCLHSTFAVEQLPIHFLRVSCTEKRNVEKSSITVAVSDVLFCFFIKNLPDSLS